MIIKNNELDNFNTPIGVPLPGVRGLRINWGTGIVIAFALYISFILYFVFSVQSNSKYDNELVYEEYYKQDAKFGEEMFRIQNAQELVQRPVILNNSNGISVVFPEDYLPKNIKGEVSFYRPSNKKFDFSIPILLSGYTMNVPKKNLLSGRWDINMEWQYDGKQFLTKEVVYIE